jgi:hypothetical protein
MQAPIESYRDLLNHVSTKYGTPISIQAASEYELISSLEKIYANSLETITAVISEEEGRTKPSSRGYNFMEFERDYMDVPARLITKNGKVSADSNARSKVDIECPNFMNSLFSLWGDLSSRSRIKDVAEKLEFIEDQKDSFGRRLAVIRPNYTIKDTTMRITTDSPNLQGLSTMYKKSYIVSEEGRKLVGADISSQEPTIFFNGLCTDDNIMKMYKECGEIYKPVVSRIEGIPLDKVDSELRKSYKLGILSKMNNAGIELLAQEMGSYELANKLNRFINTNPTYSLFMQKINRQLLLEEPKMEGFIKGRFRVIKKKNYSSKNQLINTPLQLTAVCFISISIFAFIERMMKDIGDWKNIEEFLEDVRPVLHAHDEIVLSVKDKNGYVEYAKDCLAWALGVKYENWVPLRAEPYADIIYHH